jgi:arsenate reductase
MYPDIKSFVADRLTEFDEISEERKKALGSISDFVEARVAADREALLTFICTHNSRRSHMSQLWAQTAAHYFSVPGVETFSGGTEATAFNPRAVAALDRAGFAIETPSEGDNPVYEVRYRDEMEPMTAFSKVYDQPPNPTEGFAAVMTCSSADAACPIVFGADARIAIPYDDPKAFDGTDREAAMYDERCAQIAREMLYVFSQVAESS